MLLHNSCGLNSFAFSNRAEDAITYDRVVEAYLQIGQRAVRGVQVDLRAHNGQQ